MFVGVRLWICPGVTAALDVHRLFRTLHESRTRVMPGTADP